MDLTANINMLSKLIQKLAANGMNEKYVFGLASGLIGVVGIGLVLEHIRESAKIQQQVR